MADRICFFPYVGSKYRMIPELRSLIPKHRVYVEVFGGAANLLLNKAPSIIEVYNDFNGELVNLFRVVRDRPVEFQRRLDYLIYSRGWYELFREEIRKGRLQDSLERAIAFYYLLEAGFAGKWYSGWGFGLNSGRNKTWRPSSDEILEVSFRLRNVYIDQLDFKRCIDHWDSPETLFFCDPPYLLTRTHDVIQSHYYGGFPAESHRELAELLYSIQGKFLLTYDDAPLIRELYKDCRMLSKDLPNSVIKRQGTSRPRFANLIILKKDAS